MTKHTDIRYYFIKYNIQKGHDELHFVNANEKVVTSLPNILMKQSFNISLVN